MNKTKIRNRKGELRDEYEPALIRKGVRGKYAVGNCSGTSLVALAPDVATAFPTAESVNEALRLLMQIAERMGGMPVK